VSEVTKIVITKQRLLAVALACAMGVAALSATAAPAPAPAPAPTPARATFTALTLNLWHDQHDWVLRRPVILDTLKALQPDVVFLQEVLEKQDLTNQAKQLAFRLGYAYLFTSVDPEGAPKRYGNAILTKLPITVAHEVKLDPLDDYRVANHLRLLLPDRKTEVDFYVTHLHHTDEGAAIRAKQLEGLLAFVDSTRAGPDTPVLIGGDFNATPDRPELAPVLARFTDALATIHPELQGEAAATFGRGTGETLKRIDYLFCAGAALRPEAARIVYAAPDSQGVWASDHCGVWGRFAVGE
jgi:beta-glucosidase